LIHSQTLKNGRILPINMLDCIFCKIVAGEIPASKICEDEHTIAFLDIMPANKGHCLIIPKKHYKGLLELPETILNNMINSAKKIARAMSSSVGNGSYNLVMNNGKEAGQIVFHAHIHIIPRFKDDGIKLEWKYRKYQGVEMQEYTEKIKKFIE